MYLLVIIDEFDTTIASIEEDYLEGSAQNKSILFIVIAYIGIINGGKVSNPLCL